jgi:hypothetical protein
VSNHSNLHSGHDRYFRYAQLRHEAQGAVPPPPPDLPTAAASSSSQDVPPSFDIEAAFAQLMTSMSALQREVNLIGERVKQS